MYFDLSLIDKYSSGDNLRSFLLYKPELANYSAQDLRKKDLLMLPLGDSRNTGKSMSLKNNSNYLPFLLNGSNNYGLLRGVASTAQELPSFVSEAFLMGGHFFVMPEAQTVYELQMYGATLENIPLALRFWIDHFSDQFSLTRIFLESLSEFNSMHMMRWFDSHLSMTTYILFCLVYLKFIGYGHLSSTVVTQLLHESLLFRSYTPDLAVRFSEKQSYAFFPSSGLVVQKEASPDGSLRGSYRMFFNPGTILIERELFLFGDSHSFSAMGPLLSQIFRRVHVFWGLPEDFSQFVEQHSVSNDPHLLVECCERFFLKNTQSA